MIVSPQVPLHRLVLSLSEALDHVSPSVADHQLRVAHMSTRMARALGYRGQQLRDVFHAGALHDVGLIRAENRVRAVAANQLEGLGWHGQAGYELLKDNEFFAQAAPIVRHHHAVWGEGQRQDAHGQPIPFPSHIVALADVVDRSLRRDVPVLRQTGRIVEGIVGGSGSEFCPDCVAATAVSLAERLNFSPREQVLMRAAGYLHDLGKITVHSEILDKQGKPTEEQWAVLQGHTHHTFRILDTIGGMPQISEWAAFHHERLDGEVVAVLRRDFDAVNSIRIQEQASYSVKQRHLAEVMAAAAPPVGALP